MQTSVSVGTQVCAHPYALFVCVGMCLSAFVHEHVCRERMCAEPLFMHEHMNASFGCAGTYYKIMIVHV